MKLISVTLHGYKRFAQPSTMNVDGKLIAVVGPNEAGKSSFLQALTRMSDYEPLSTSGANRETTRNSTLTEDQAVIKATYLLEDGDREALENVHGGEAVRWCTVSRLVDGSHIFSFSPTPKRELEPRSKAVEALRKVLPRRGFINLAEEYEETNLAATVSNLASTLETKSRNLPGETLDQIRSVVETLNDAVSENGLKYLRDLERQLHNLAEFETGNPVRQCREILSERRPEILDFSDDKRLLQAEYNLAQASENPPAALDNLAKLADLNLFDLQTAVSQNDSAEVASIEGRTNTRLKKEFEAWSQSDVAPSFRTEEGVLKVLMEEPDSRFTSVSERSDGLRQFVALLAFAASMPPRRGRILLIDEAETHLHYDAQADLIQMLARQDIVSKVIYTTHSLGCLPEDLGTGVRFVRSEPDSYTSRMENSFWTSEQSGFSPLLFGMGASTLAFNTIRNAVVAEGPSDMILWPTLFREATNRSYLDFQIVPGISESNTDQITELDRQATRTAYLLDADKKGNELRRNLIRSGISKNRIRQIPDARKQGFVLEDLVDEDIYAQAVNEELRRSHGLGFEFPTKRLPKADRPKAVEKWCKNKGINSPKKTAVAYRILESSVGCPVLAKHHRGSVERLFSDISAALQDSANS